MTQQIRAVLSAVLGRAASQREALAGIQRAWPRLVGKTLAAHTQPASLQRGRLTVYAEQPVDSYALSYQQPRLLERLRTVSCGRIEEIVVRVGRR